MSSATIQNSDENYLLTFDRKWFCVSLSIFVFVFAFATFMRIEYAFRLPMCFYWFFAFQRNKHTLAKILFTYASHSSDFTNNLTFKSQFDFDTIRFSTFAHFPLSSALFGGWGRGWGRMCTRATQCVQVNEKKKIRYIYQTVQHLKFVPFFFTL